MALDFETKKRQGRPPAVQATLLLASIDGLFQFGPGCEFGYSTGSNLDGRAGLRIATVPRLSL